MNLRKFWRKAFTNVRHKYRFSVTDESFHEKLSFRLSTLNVWTIIAVGSISVVAITLAIVIFTPVRQLVPGYIKKELVEQSLRDRMRLDSLQMRMEAQNAMLKVLTHTLSGEIPMEESEIIRDSLRNYQNIPYRIALEDSLLRKEIENADKYIVDNPVTLLSGHDPANNSFSDNIVFYTPVEGNIIKKFNYQEKHFGIDIESEDNAVIKAVLDGDVIFTSWSPEWGHILVLDHENNLISLYCSASTLFKHAGDFVKAGEAIGIAGRSTEHNVYNLHFEFWYNGTPVDPEEYLAL